MQIKPTDHIASLAKGLRMLEAFGAQQPKMSIAEAAAVTGLDRATARRCLLTLYHEGYTHYDGKYFTLSYRALRLGRGVIEALELPQIVQPWLDQLTEQIGESCSVAILDQTEIVYLARAAQRRVMSIGLSPGSRLPAFCTSLGRVLLAELPADEARARLAQSNLTPRTPHSLTDPAELMNELVQIQSQGFAVIDQEVEIGLRSIAVPLQDGTGKVVAALNTGMAAVHGHVGDLIVQYLPHLQRVQTGLKRIL